MAHAHFHSVSSVRKFGGCTEDYMPLHEWFDQTKMALPDNRHRLLLHNSVGIFLAEQVFGKTLKRKDGKETPTRTVAEQHVIEDLGFIPTLEQCFEGVPVHSWLISRARPLSKEVEHATA